MIIIQIGNKLITETPRQMRHARIRLSATLSHVIAIGLSLVLAKLTGKGTTLVTVSYPSGTYTKKEGHCHSAPRYFSTVEIKILLRRVLDTYDSS